MDRKEKNVLIIGAEVQPIPPVEGGAVELLVNYIVEENEKDKFSNLTIASPYTNAAFEESRKYKNTKFYFVKGTNSLIAKLVNFIDLFNRRFFNKTSGIYYIHKICKLVKKEKYDLIIVENRPLFGKIIRKHYKGPLFLHLHNDFININTKMKEQILNSFNKILVISNYLKNRILEIENKDIEVVYNGIDLSLYSAPNIPNKKVKKIVYAGRLVREKGVLELVKAFKKLDEDNIELTIIGDYDFGAEDEKEFKEELLQLTKDSNNIKLLGYVNNNQISKYYQDAYVGVVPSVVNEALSLTAIEMLAAGLPVISTNAGGLPEVVNDKCGMIVNRDNLINNLYNGLKELIDNEEIRNSMSNNTKDIIEKFGLDLYISNFKNILKR